MEKKDENCQMTLDLKTNAAVKIVAPGSMNFGANGTIIGKRDGNYSVELNEGSVRSVWRLFGVWWVDAALRGAISQLPLTNVSPKVVRLSEPLVHDGTDNSLANSVEKMELEEKTPTSEVKSLQIVQSHFVVDLQGNGHKWGLQLAPGAEDLVSEVVYLLHPTFQLREVKCTEPPFSIDRTGWGTFTIGITVVLKSGQKLETTHALTFEGTGDNVKVTEMDIGKK